MFPCSNSRKCAWEWLSTLRTLVISGEGEKEGGGWGVQLDTSVSYKRMRSKHGRLLGFDRPGDVSQLVRVSFFLFLYDGNILQCKLKVNIKRLWAEDQFSMACGQGAAAKPSSFLLLPSFPVRFRKDAPLPPSPPPALQVTAPFPLPGSPGRWGWDAILQLSPLCVPICLSCLTQLSDGPVLELGTSLQMAPKYWLSEHSSLTWSVNFSSSASLHQPALKANVSFLDTSLRRLYSTHEQTSIWGTLPDKTDDSPQKPEALGEGIEHGCFS